MLIPKRYGGLACKRTFRSLCMPLGRTRSNELSPSTASSRCLFCQPSSKNYLVSFFHAEMGCCNQTLVRMPHKSFCAANVAYELIIGVPRIWATKGWGHPDTDAMILCCTRLVNVTDVNFTVEGTAEHLRLFCREK